MKCFIKPPSNLLRPMKIPKKLLMGPGPSNCSPRVLNALSEQMLGHMDEDFMTVMNDVKCGIQYAFQTENEMTFAVSGTGHCAMETAICNVVEPDDVVLILSSGIWGERAQTITKKLGAECHKMQITDGDVLQLKYLKTILTKLKPSVVFICHGDSSTGVLQPLSQITTFLKGFDCIIIVDAVASLGASPIFMDRWAIDILYSGSQKILSAPPGISPISFSANAVNKIKSRKTPVTTFYMDALLLGNYWKCDGKPTIYHHTAPISLVYALREALAILSEETLEECWKRHAFCAEKLYECLQNIGLDLFVSNKEYRLPSVTTVKIPAGISGQDVVKRMKENFGIDIAGGLGSTAGIVWRIGLMGHNCSHKNVTKTVSALSKCIKDSSLKSSL